MPAKYPSSNSPLEIFLSRNTIATIGIAFRPNHCTLLPVLARFPKASKSIIVSLEPLRRLGACKAEDKRTLLIVNDASIQYFTTNNPKLSDFIVLSTY